MSTTTIHAVRTVRRVRAGTAPVQQQAAAPLVARRLRTAPAPVDHAAIDAELSELLQSIAQADSQIDSLVEQRDTATERIKTLMETHKRTGHLAHGYKATLAESYSRESTEIDPKQFKARVGDTDFWKTVRVNVTDARTVLSEREIGEISKTTPKKYQGMKLKVEQLKTKVERK